MAGLGGGGGIAAAAAVAAAAKKRIATPSGSGLATAAAKKGQDTPAGLSVVAAAAATAASAMSVETKVEDSGKSNGAQNHNSAFELDILVAVMEEAASEASANPRDLPSFYCLYLLAKRLEELSSTRTEDAGQSETLNTQSKEKKAVFASGEMDTLSKRLLLRSLAISNQASSLGMVGWLEYGSSNPLERTLSLPFEVLQRLACSFAASNDWIRASDVLSSLLMRCEQHLPTYHPTTLSTMLDLAASVMMAYDYSLAKGLIQRVSYLLAVYLSEHEAMHFDKFRSRASFERNGKKFHLDNGADALSMIKAFAATFHEELSRKFLSLIGPNHKITLLNHSLVADSFSVLANCLSAGEAEKSLQKSSPSASGHLYYWSLAYTHYQQALRGWVKVGTLAHPNAASAAYSVARSLRELGRLDQALKILGALVSSLQQHCTSAEDEDDSLATLTFLPPRSNYATRAESTFPLPACRKEQSLVLCLWMMAVLTVDQSPDERGRIRALSLLHSASDALRRVLGHPDHVYNDMDELTRRVCFELYECVEQEARDLFEPLQLIDMPPQKHETAKPKKHNVADLLTPMRRRRWHAQNRSGRQKGDQRRKAIVKTI